MTTIKVALCGDLHTNVARRSEEARRVAYWIADDAKARGAHFLGIGGDGIDGPMTEKDRDWLMGFSDYCGGLFSTFWLQGNHEPALSLRCLRGRKTKFPVIVEEGAGVHVIETPVGKLAVAAVAFPQKAQLLAHVGPVSSEDADRIAGQALQDVFRGLGVQVEQLGLPTVGLIHGTIKGSKISDDQPDRPLGLDIDIADLELMNCDFICAPHIHKANEFSWGGKIFAVTPTSPFYTSYGEATQFKGYILAEFETEGYYGGSQMFTGGAPRTVHEVKWARVPTPATPMLLMEAHWVEDNGLWHMRVAANDPEDVARMLIPGGLLAGADVRFRFHFPADQRKAASANAENWAQAARDSGAVNITLDPTLTPTVRSRIPQLATTQRLEDKWLLYCQAITLELSEERKAVLLDCLRLLQEEAAAMGLAMGTTGRAAPAIKRARLKGFMKFPNEVEINFAELAGPLTTIIAPNESGKSLLCQVLGPGVLYGDTSDRGSLDDLSVATDSFVEEEFEMGGAEYKLVQNANGKDRKGSVSLLKNKQPVLSKAGRREYAEWGSKNLLPRNVYDAIICQSGTESIIDMKDGPRVELLLRVLGLEIYEALAESARKKAAAVASTLSGVRTRIEEIGMVDLSALNAAVSSIHTGVDGWLELLAGNERALAEKRALSREVDQQRSEYNALVSRRGELAAQTSRLRERIAELTTKIEVNQEITDQAEVIEAADVEMVRLGHDLATQATIDQLLRIRYSEEYSTRTALESRRDDVAGRRDLAQATVETLTTRLADVDTKRKDARAVLKTADAIRRAVTETASLQASLKTKEAELAQLRIKVGENASALNDVRSRLRVVTQRQGELESRITTARPLADTKEFVLQAVEDAKRLSLDVVSIRSDVDRFKNEVRSLEFTLSTATVKRVSILREGHEVIAAGTPDPAGRAARALADDDDIVAEEQDTPLGLTEAKGWLEEAEQKLRFLEGALRTAQATAGNLPFVEKAEAETKECLATLEGLLRESHSLIGEGDQIQAQGVNLVSTAEQTRSDVARLLNEIEAFSPLVAKAELLTTADTRIQGLDEQRASITLDLKAATTSVSTLAAEVFNLDGEIDAGTDALRRIGQEQADNESVIELLNNQMVTAKALAAKAPDLNAARIRIEEFSHQKSGLVGELETLEHEHDKLERQIDGTVLLELIDLAPFEAAVISARQSLTDYQTRLALAQKEFSDAQAKESRRQELASQVRGLEEQVSNWTLLGQHLGKTGLQAEEISCAGPQLTTLTNDLLQAGGDTRHSVSISTEKLHSNKKDLISCLDILIYDSEEAQTKEAKRLSMGGKKLVGEPLSLAMVILGCQRAGITSPTIFRDEASNSLDQVNTPRYCAMLRRFAQILEARVIFISQNPEIWELADSRINLVGDGQIKIS